ERNRGALSQAGKVMAAEQAFVAYDAHVGDSDQNNTLCFGVPSLAAGVLHRGTRLRSLEMILDGKILPGSVRSAVCADWKDDRNGAAGLAAQEAEGEQEEILPPRQVGKEQKERVAQTPEQGERKTKDRRNCHELVKLVPVAPLALIFEVLEAFDVAQQPFATFPSTGRCRRRCVRRAWD
ncbi:MAG TPA: hypothetical protein VF905_00165, partial [Nitrospirota bacterium]